MEKSGILFFRVFFGVKTGEKGLILLNFWKNFPVFCSKERGLGLFLKKRKNLLFFFRIMLEST